MAKFNKQPARLKGCERPGDGRLASGSLGRLASWLFGRAGGQAGGAGWAAEKAFVTGAASLLVHYYFVEAGLRLVITAS